MAATFRDLVARDATREQLEEWCRAQARAIPIGRDLVLCRVLGKYLMYCLSRDYALTPHLALDGIWEPWVTMAITRHVRPGMRCLDVGACYGYYSLLMADITGETVHAWEPYHHELLMRNGELNGSQLGIWAMALGNDTAAAVIVAPPPRDGLGLFNAGGVEVVRKFDGSALRDGECDVTVARPTGSPSYDFIKIDVEGHEVEVWDALNNVRASSQHLTVCMEFTPSKHAEPGGFLEQLSAAGFRLGTVGHDGTPRTCSHAEALEPDTGAFRMLWLTR